MAINLYSAPTPGSETGRASGLRLSDELRGQIVGIARLMLVAGGVQIVPAVLLLIDDISPPTLFVAGLLGIVPLFVMVAAISLLGLSRNEAGDMPILLNGLRQLTVAYAIKGVFLVLLIVLGLASFVFGFSAAALR